MRRELEVPVITDVHEDSPIEEVSEVVDVLQTPAFLCRQTNFITKVCSQGLPVNIKKGQFLAPLDMLQVVKKRDLLKTTGSWSVSEVLVLDITIWSPTCEVCRS